MKYELISKDTLDEICDMLNIAKELLNKPSDPEFRVTAKTWVERAQRSIERNRKQCNVKPEDES